MRLQLEVWVGLLALGAQVGEEGGEGVLRAVRNPLVALNIEVDP